MNVLDLAAEHGPAESIETLVARQELGRVVEAAMAALPEEQRTAIILKEYHGLTFQEIADLLGCPLSTVKTRLYQGLTVLRRQLQRDGLIELAPPVSNGVSELAPLAPPSTSVNQPL